MLKEHQFRGRLGMGDLHPGGAPVTAMMLQWLTERGVRRVLEVGAGIGNTSARMVSLGWDVTAIEPDPVLFRRLRRQPCVSARHESFLDHAAARPYDAVVAESVFFQMSLPETFVRARALLRPGGYLAFVEAVWSDGITAEQSRDLHEKTTRLFGIPVGSREPLTWRDWSRHLQEAGFETLQAQQLPRGSAGHPPSSNRVASLAAIARDPLLLLWMARFAKRKRAKVMPARAQESWLFLGRSPAV